MDPNRAFIVPRPTLQDLQTSDPLTFPNTLPDELVIEIPSPRIEFPEWTTSPYEFDDDDTIPQTLRNLVEPPERKDCPAFYKAAVDTIQITNEYFWLHNQPLKDEIDDTVIERRMEAWENEMLPRERYPIPPDPRTLLVKGGDESPMYDEERPLWAKACDAAADMADDDWERYLSHTRENLDDEFRDDQESFMLHLFVRYLVWREYVNETSDRHRRYREHQPTFDELSAFFDEDHVIRDGATLAEINNVFPHAWDIRMLVHRIQRFADLREPIGPVPVAVTGQPEPAERRYHRKPDAIRDELPAVLNRLFAQHDSITLYMVAELFFPSAENIHVIVAALEYMAARDVTTHRWIHRNTEAPSDEEILEFVNDDHYLNGFTLEEVAEHFPNRVWSLTSLRTFLDNLRALYYDDEEERHFPLFETEGGGYNTEEESIRMRFVGRVSKWDEETILREYYWDRGSMRYEIQPPPPYEPRAVPQGSPTEVATSHGGSPPLGPSPPYEEVVGAGPPRESATPHDRTPTPAPLPQYPGFIDLGSPTEVATSHGGSPPRGPSPPGLPPPNAVHVPVAVIEVVPVEPAALPDDNAATPGDAPAAPPAPAAGPSGRGRPAKRRAEDAAEAAGPAKKGRKNPKIRCSGRTKKGLVCKNQKDREDGEGTWYCTIHRRD